MVISKPLIRRCKMGVLVSDLCELQVFKDHLSLVSGRNGLNKEVKQITALDNTSIGAFKAENYFVLTTFYMFSNNEEKIIDAVSHLAESNISAIGVKSRYIGTLPQAVIDIAEKNDIPLFLVDAHLPFAEIIACVASEITGNQYNVLSTLQQQQSSLFNAIFQNRPLENLLELSGKLPGKDCACYTPDGNLIASWSTNREDIPENILSVIKMLPRELSGSDESPFRVDGLNIFPCYAHKRLLAYLAVVQEEALSEYDILYYRQLVSFISIKQLENRIVWETERRMTSNILNDILSNHYSSAVILERLYPLGFVPSDNYCVVAIKTSANLEQCMRRLSLQLEGIFPHSILLLNQNGLMAILPLHKTFSKEHVKNRIDQIILSKNKSGSAYAGISSLRSELSQITDSFHEAQAALKIGQIFSTDRIFDYDDYFGIDMLNSLLGSNAHQHMQATVIDRLSKYEKSYGGEYWKTLGQCIFSDSLEIAAKNLHIHKSTLRYRLNKIGEITGVDYFTNAGKYLLTTAYYLFKLETGEDANAMLTH
jgi:purine catabolism regulator